MTEQIKCPKCSEVFTIDETAYESILKQVRDKEFASSIEEKVKVIEENKNLEFEIKKTQIRAKHEQEIFTLKKENEEKNQVEKNKNLEFEIEKTKIKSDYEQKILALKNEKDQRDQVEKNKNLEFELEKNEINSNHAKEILVLEKEKEERDKVIDRLKNMSLQLSTKMVGETLEQHCEIEFSKLRATAFRNAYFEKDNDIRSGSKGDYIFKDYDENGVEIISIMFEMKNESDTTVTKKKNEDFLKELDKDRNEKKCEYAVLVSLLETENDLYNAGIVDKSHRFPKMYVVRPGFFIPIISLLRNAAMKTLEVQNELALIKQQNIDVNNFETKLLDFKKGYQRNYRLAGEQYESAIEQINKSIQSLEKTKEELNKSANNLRLANDKLQEVTVKRLTRDNPTMARRFEEGK